MPDAPAQSKIYHLVHVDRLASIVSDGQLWSDSVMMQRSGGGTTIGMSGIKKRRLSLPVKCYAGDNVGDYVPFYFCPRSIMLYVIHKANHPELAYRGGQSSIIHLQADLRGVVAWADANKRRWAFSLSNAGAYYTEFRSSLTDLHEVDWDAVHTTDFRSAEVKEGKQAELLVHESFPFDLVERIGVFSRGVAQQASTALQGTSSQPAVEIRRDWYY